MTGARPGPGSRLVPAAVAAWLAAGVGIGLPAWLWGIAGASAIAAVCAVLLRRPWASLVAIALAAAALVTTSAAVREPQRTPAELDEAARDGRPVSLAVAVTGRTEHGRFGAMAAGAPLLVFTNGEGEPPAIGAVVQIEADLQRTAEGDDVAYLAFVDDPLVELAEPSALLAGAESMREAFRTAAAGLPDPGRGLLPGLAIGDDSGVPPALDEAMTASSLSHLTAVSGANCAVVVGIVVGVLAAAGAPRIVRVGGAGLALAAFVVLVTPEPSVLRAAVMTAVALTGVAIGRPAAGLPLLCVTVVGLLAIDPWLARSFGFALSVLATAGLLVLASPLSRSLARLLPTWLAGVLAIPLAAQLACQPVLLLLDPALPLYGVPANLLAAPAAPVATVLGLCACLAALLLPWLATGIAAVAWLPASWIAAVAELFAALPGARGPWPEGPLGVGLLIALEAVLLTALLPGVPAAGRRFAAAAAAAGVLAYSLGLAGLRLAQLADRPADWQIAMCDIGQGDATLIRSAGRIALVDTGPAPAPLRACLDDLGVDRIDLLVLTHFDLDHVGGVEALLGRTDTVLTGPTGEAADESMLAGLAHAGASVLPVQSGDRGVLGELRWHAAWPPPRGAEPGNEASIALLVEPAAPCECLSALLLGDLGETAQLRMAAATAIPEVDVVKVSHHGSADQSAALYAAAGATVGLIGVGADNDYGHPTGELLGILASAGTSALRTDRQGMILLAPGDQPGEVEVWTER